MCSRELAMVFVEVREQPTGASCLLSPCGAWGLNSVARHGGKHPHPLSHLASPKGFRLRLKLLLEPRKPHLTPVVLSRSFLSPRDERTHSGPRKSLGD